MSALSARAHALASQENCDGEPYDTLQECADALALLVECADLLREDIEGCANCNYGHGATGISSEGETCESCTPHRDLLKRIEGVM